jgi:acetyl-CoA carboxylase, biotin carboxylase subunit
MTFSNVLVANRGEIALRALEACRELSIDTVGVFSQADRQMPYLSLASKRMCIGPANPAKSYLSIPAIISAAKLSNAEAVYPGYGFLAENPDFVEVCEDHGLVFIGPPRETMALVGNKLAAREAVAAAGVDVLPGHAVSEDKDVMAVGDKVGYPLLVKSTYGGGGRGMRFVEHPQELESAILAARSEAKAACGNDSLYLEHAVESPRHIEVQILADAQGNVVHFGERECSVQRRHQKLIEESPASRLDEKTRKALHVAAIKVARAVGYVNAGTVEFIFDSQDQFYFIEMNARIQVEHSVSEVVSQVNLVKEQIRIASGDPLRFTQDKIDLRGHGLECRINAEDPANGFLPSAGKVTIDELPTGFGIRLDTHLYNGMEMKQYYDSLLAKVISWGEDRKEACIRMYTALERFRVRGIQTTRSFAQEIVSDPSFRNERITTDFLSKFGAD